MNWLSLCAKLLQSCPTLCDSMDCSLPGSSVCDFPGKNTGVGCHFPLQLLLWWVPKDNFKNFTIPSTFIKLAFFCKEKLLIFSIHLLMSISMQVWIYGFLLYSIDNHCNITVIITLMLKLSQIWSVRVISMWLLHPFDIVSIILWAFPYFLAHQVAGSACTALKKNSLFPQILASY